MNRYRIFRELQQGKQRHYEMIKQLRRKDAKGISINPMFSQFRTVNTAGYLGSGTRYKICRAELARFARMNQMVAVTGTDRPRN
jgi:hypothetical protein